MSRNLNAIQGCLIGGAVGDALGYPVEFKRWGDIARRYGKGGIQDYELDFGQGMAIISDDTQMTLYTANGLLMCETRRALTDRAPSPKTCIYEAYLDWYHCQRSPGMPSDNRSWLSEYPEMHEWRAPGNTCLSALGGGTPGSVETPVNHSKGCGGIMRVAPVALWNGGGLSNDEAVMLAAQAAAITHGHPLGYLPAAALVDIIIRVMASEGADLYDVAEGCEADMKRLFGDNPFLGDLLSLMELAAELARGDGPDVDNIHRLGEGWTGEEALAIALYCCLRYQDDFSRAMIASVNHNGDSDSTGAVAGNILGARLGLDGIDGKWLKNLELRDVILELGRDLCEGCPADGEGRIADEDWKRKYVAWCER